MSIQLPISINHTGSFDSYLAYVNNLPMLNEAQEKTLFLDYQEHNNLAAAQQIILAHLRFVAFIARSYKGYGLPIEDLVQEGTVGLMKSVKKFSLDYGVRLSSFAVHYIKAEIQEFVIRNWRLVKSATTKAKRKLFYNLKRLKTNIGWLTNKEKKEISTQLKVSEEDINDMELQISQPDILINSVEKNEQESTHFNIENILEDKSAFFETSLIQDDFKQKALHEVNNIVNTLDERSKDIVVHRWLSSERKTHKFFSNKYGVSQERIRQIEEKALQKMKHAMLELKT
mgnify:CR=1 FL=1